MQATGRRRLWRQAIKVMGNGLHGGASVFEDYTCPFGRPAKVLAAHMPGVCPSIAVETPSCEIHPLSISGKSDPARLVFTGGGSGSAMITKEVDVVKPDHELPRHSVARAVWIPTPDLPTAVAARFYAGGARHTGFSRSLNAERLRDFAEMADVECFSIDKRPIAAVSKRASLGRALP